jgi:hypothetical protein
MASVFLSIFDFTVLSLFKHKFAIGFFDGKAIFFRICRFGSEVEYLLLCLSLMIAAQLPIVHKLTGYFTSSPQHNPDAGDRRQN